jgi:hypothetical protein
MTKNIAFILIPLFVILLLFEPLYAQADKWDEVPTASAPEARNKHSAVWTGTEMVIWGGMGTSISAGTSLYTGAKYNPNTNQWTTMTNINAPIQNIVGRHGHTAVWTGGRMIVWGGAWASMGVGGDLNTGGIYTPALDQWAGINSVNAPSARQGHTAIWTGSRMIVWGGTATGTPTNTGGIYDPSTDSWTTTSTTNAPSPRSGHTSVWTGSKMLIWGGFSGTDYLQDGGIYDLATDTWTAISTAGAPAARAFHSVVWTGELMLVWGGKNATTTFNNGGKFNPVDNSWSSILSTGAPTPRYDHRAVWTGEEMWVWGGIDSQGGVLASGSRYNLSSGKWTVMTTTSAPAARKNFSATLGTYVTDTGEEAKLMIIWGGDDGTTLLGTGSRYSVTAQAAEITLGTGGTAHICTITSASKYTDTTWWKFIAGILLLILFARFIKIFNNIILPTKN